MPLQITPRELALQLENGRPFRLVDVRQAWENQVAALPDSLLIPLGELPKRAKELAGSEPIIVYCHHGVRSLSAADYLIRLGLTDVQSLAGGIDAWSCEVDPTVPRY